MLTRNVFRRLFLAVLISIGILNAACDVDPLRVARSAMVARPLVDSLVETGALPKVLGETVITDFADGGESIAVFAVALRGIAKDDPDKRFKQSVAAQKLASDWKAIVARGHFNVHPNVNKAFKVADGFLQSVIAYYDPGSRTDSGPGASTATQDDLSEKEFFKTLEPELKKLKEALNP